MSPSNLVRWGGLAAVLGGVLWVVVFVIFASRPSGPGLEPPYRSFEGLGFPVLISLLLIVAGLVALHIRLRDLYGRLGTAGFIVALVGAFLLAISGGGLWPLDFIGLIVLTIGSLLVGVATLITNASLRWGAIALIVGSVALLLFNTETAQAWFALLYGVAWVMMGYLLWAVEGEMTRQRPPRVR